MGVYVVTWNLNKERSNYDQARRAFVEHLDRYESIRDAGLETVRWVSTTHTPLQVRDFLRQKLDSNDKLYVSKVNRGEHDGWLNKAVWEWISARV